MTRSHQFNANKCRRCLLATCCIKLQRHKLTPNAPKHIKTHQQTTPSPATRSRHLWNDTTYASNNCRRDVMPRYRNINQHIPQWSVPGSHLLHQLGWFSPIHILEWLPPVHSDGVFPAHIQHLLSVRYSRHKYFGVVFLLCGAARRQLTWSNTGHARRYDARTGYATINNTLHIDNSKNLIIINIFIRQFNSNSSQNVTHEIIRQVSVVA